jgi:predicted aspartyl protease
MEKVLGLGIVILAISPIAGQAQTPQQGQQYTKVKYDQQFTLQHKPAQMLVQVVINGNIPATFMVDTGTTNTIIDGTFAKRLGLPLKSVLYADGKPVLFQGKRLTGVVATTFQLGGFTVSTQSLTILPGKDFVPPYGQPYDGILGVDILQRLAVLIDPQTHTLVLCYPGLLKPSELKTIGVPDDAVVLPLTRKTFGWYGQATETNQGVSSEEDILVDTGSDGTTISEATAQKLRLKLGNQQKVTGFSDSTIVNTGTLDTLSLGQISVFKVPVTIRAIPPFVAPLLGMDILSGYRVLMDFPAKKMYLQPNPSVVPTVTIGPAPTPAVPPAK